MSIHWRRTLHRPSKVCSLSVYFTRPRERHHETPEQVFVYDGCNRDGASNRLGVGVDLSARLTGIAARTRKTLAASVDT